MPNSVFLETYRRIFIKRQKEQYEKLQKHYMDFVNALIEDVFGNPTLPDGIEEGEDNLVEE